MDGWDLGGGYSMRANEGRGGKERGVTVDLGWNGLGPGRRRERWKWSMCKEKGAPLGGRGRSRRGAIRDGSGGGGGGGSGSDGSGSGSVVGVRQSNSAALRPRNLPEASWREGGWQAVDGGWW
jgi:hypothetical protein